jgi:hypothetical protein
MKYMLIMRATDEAFQNMADIDFNEMLETIGKFNDELIRAGVLLAAEGLDDAEEGVVVDYSAEPPVRPRSCSAGSTSSTWRPRRRPSSGPSGSRSPVRASRPRSAGSPRSTSSRRTTSG